jgi:hypothetical protein
MDPNPHFREPFLVQNIYVRNGTWIPEYCIRHLFFYLHFEESLWNIHNTEVKNGLFNLEQTGIINN